VVGNNFYLCIIKEVKQFNRLPSIKKLGTTKQNLNYYVKRLKIKNIINKIGYGTWEYIGSEEIKEVKEVKESSGATKKTSKRFLPKKKEIRGHGFIIKFKIPKEIYKWNHERRKEYLTKNNIPFKVIGSNWKGERITIRKHKIWLTDKSIVIYTPKGMSYFGGSAEESWKYAIYDIENLLISVENLLKISFRINGKHKFRIGRQHYAKIQDKLAEQYSRDGKKLLCLNKNGEIWLTIDKSYTNELEFQHKNTAKIDTDNIVSYMNSLKEYNEKTGEIANYMKDRGLLSDVIKNQSYFGENLVSHTNAIKKMAELLEKIEKKLN